ncbi:serine protease [Sphingomonas oligophenolica]|uniref:Serine protease n=2 Tax=Sphingomonas oligophenolica TaxID=301154 RepID=A0A502CJN8_9SPHN|nr:serine protease [Sphingomonas oligophenolica]
MAATMSKRHLALVAPLLFAACAPQPERVVERRVTEAPAPRGPALLRTAMLAGQNAARAAVGAPRLIWDNNLAVDAQRYAQQMARTGRFEHAKHPQLVGDEGENLWKGSRDAYAYREMVGHWLAEKADFVDRPVPDSSRTGRFEDVGHYTQIIWRATRTVGCAMASNATDDYLVCRYLPAGNVVGERVG